ncbi:GD11851 [Drosophila simulans]|uniref:GD11851 n=1 Tax=Drosophila simulans TaxID=7240 RepID=B4QBX3_DROSI|nr:GD11851 [Drosophila simulans]
MREIVHLQAGQCGNQIGAKSLQLKSRCWSHNNAERTKWNWSVKDGLDDNGIEMDRNRDLELELKL